MWRERYFHDGCGARLAAHDELYRRSRLGKFTRDISHGDRAASSWSEAATRNLANDVAVHILDFSMFAGGGAAFGLYSDEAFG